MWTVKWLYLRSIACPFPGSGGGVPLHEATHLRDIEDKRGCFKAGREEIFNRSDFFG
jgi:hypothetical protein